MSAGGPPRTDAAPDAFVPDAGGPARAAATAGGKLRAAREAAGLSVDVVAQQLKLAPRQVKAIENDDWQHLPGRTFARGFARNYARFVHVDPDTVLALLPTADAAPALERPTLAASPRPMGEIPVERVTKPSSARWLFVLLLLVIVGAIAYYESSRLQFHLPALMGEHAEKAATPDAPAVAIVSSSAPTAHGTAALPNPVAGAGPAVSDASNAAGDAPHAAGDAVSPATNPATVSAAPAPPDAAAPAASAPTPSAVPGEPSLVLTFKGTSWAEVKDAKGRVVLQMTGGPGMTQTVSAMPPLELALGNAPQVDVTYRGQSLDLSSYTRGNVARVSLQ